MQALAGIHDLLFLAVDHTDNLAVTSSAISKFA
jgi:hypothetical protein